MVLKINFIFYLQFLIVHLMMLVYYFLLLLRLCLLCPPLRNSHLCFLVGSCLLGGLTSIAFLSHVGCILNNILVGFLGVGAKAAIRRLGSVSYLHLITSCSSCSLHLLAFLLFFSLVDLHSYPLFLPPILWL